MKKILCFDIMKIFLTLLFCLFATFSHAGMIIKGTTASSTCTLRFSDTFTRSDSGTIGNGWIEAAGGWDISSNTIKSNATWSYLVSGTNLSATTQFIRVTLTTAVGGKNSGLFIRTDPSTGDPGYKLHFDGWYTAWLDTDGTIQTSGSLGWTSGDVVGVVVKGTGNGTVVSIWENPLNNTPYSGGGACTDTSKPCWDSVSDTPDLQFTNDPTSVADAYYGHGLLAEGANQYYDNYYAGDCSD